MLSQFVSCTDINVTIDTGNITGSVESYSYPTQAMIISGLNSGTTYNYCIVYYNATNMMEIGEPVCGSFATQKTTTKTNDDGKFYGMVDIRMCIQSHQLHNQLLHTCIRSAFLYMGLVYVKHSMDCCSN